MTAYAIAHFHRTSNHPQVIEYIDRIQATLDPFGGRFLVHGGEQYEMEGRWAAAVILEFPDLAKARAWYHSPAYQDILHLRADHTEAEIVLVEGVAPDYDPSATAAALRRAAQQDTTATT
ncbi:DUF1330 domain-containing protein [Streptomyces orinoci]|uniref:DUF1330 domain-containing protein n=1 Tax=Streptomyces orinoci TaxID=67339 RepID=A0ABV3JZM1_STRON|nr:DUF1330 domain-containing protein [Streptomyces orinoci]